jgi:hypothetical protein
MGLANKGKQIPLHNTEVKEEALDVQELEFLLSRIKEMTFRGNELEVLTRVVLKLQNRYIKLTNKK